MTGPIHSDVAFADLKTLQEASLRDRAAHERWVTSTAENEEVTGAWVVLAESLPVQYAPMGAKTAELAAAVGVVATGVVKQRKTGGIEPGDRLMVRGARSGVRFWRLVNVGVELQAPGWTCRRMTVTDTDLSRG